MIKNLPLIISLIAVMLAFCLWYMFAYREYSIQNTQYQTQIRYIDISTTSKNITIKNTPKNIRFRVSGNIIHTGSVELK
jgi:YbbR domain-containing protein